MIPAPFDYYRALSVEEAISLLREHDGAKLLAGGHSLVPLLKLRLSAVPALIDVGRIEALRGMSKSGDTLRIGALTTHAMLEASDEIPAALKDAAGLIGDPAVRNLGTVGGSLAHADPAADLPPVFLALDAMMQIQGPDGERKVSADEFFTGMFETALGEHEILTAVEIPLTHHGSAYVKLADPASRYALIGCAAALTVADGRCRAAKVAIGGMLPQAKLLPSVEAALVATSVDAQAIDNAAGALSQDIDFEDVMGDISGSAEYRFAVAPEMVKRALLKATERIP